MNSDPKPPAPPFDPLTLLAKIKGNYYIQLSGESGCLFARRSSEFCFLYDKGEVKLTVFSEQGKEAIIAILEPGDFFGEGCLAGQIRRLARATAVVECKIMRLEKAAMTSLIHNEPEFSERFLSHLLARKIRVEADLVDQLFNSSEKRLARLLLILARFGKEGAFERVIPKIRQEALAEMIGTTRSRVNFFMNKFRKFGFY